MNILDLLAKFFKMHSVQNDERFAEFMKFSEEMIDAFPAKVIKKIHGKVHPSSNYPTYTADFTGADIVWWKIQYKDDLVEILPIDEIKKQTELALASLINTGVGLDDDSKKIMDMIHQLESNSSTTINLEK